MRMTDAAATGDGMPATADLVDSHGEELDSIPVQFRSFGLRGRFGGPVVTLKCFEDNALLKATLGDPAHPPGSVLAVDGAGSMRTALVGDLIAGLAVERGWAGLVIYGAVRDSAALNRLPIGIKALGTNPRKSTKTGAGSVGEVIEIAGVRIVPGQTLYSDEDGIVILRRNGLR
jgi:regulator of ribonuclease activity A